MAKAVENLAIVIFAGLIYWFKERNEARMTGQYGDDKESEKVMRSMTNDGWFRTGDGIIEVCRMSKEDQDRALKLLQNRWEELKAEAEQTNNTLSLKTWEAIHVQNGKLVKPEYEGISGNRRGSLLHKVNIARNKVKPEDGGPLPPITEIPVIVKEFANEQERMDAQMMENTRKAEGYLPPSDLDMLKWSIKRVQLGGLQKDLRRVLTDTTGQKYYWIIELNRRFPKAGFIERLCKPVDDTAHIRLSAVKGNELPNLGLRSDPEKLAEHNAKAKNKGKAGDILEPLTLERFQAYLNEIGKKPVSNEKKMMDKDTIKSLAGNNAGSVIERVLDAVIQNNTDGLKALVDNTEASKALLRLIDEGDGPFIEQVMSKLLSVNGDHRVKLFKKMIEA